MASTFPATQERAIRRPPHPLYPTGPLVGNRKESDDDMLAPNEPDGPPPSPDPSPGAWELYRQLAEQLHDEVLRQGTGDFAALAQHLIEMERASGLHRGSGLDDLPPDRRAAALVVWGEARAHGTAFGDAERDWGRFMGLFSAAARAANSPAYANVRLFAHARFAALVRIDAPGAITAAAGESGGE